MLFTEAFSIDSQPVIITGCVVHHVVIRIRLVSYPGPEQNPHLCRVVWLH